MGLIGDYLFNKDLDRKYSAVAENLRGSIEQILLELDSAKVVLDEEDYNSMKKSFDGLRVCVNNTDGKGKDFAFFGAWVSNAVGLFAGSFMVIDNLPVNVGFLIAGVSEYSRLFLRMLNARYTINQFDAIKCKLERISMKINGFGVSVENATVDDVITGLNMQYNKEDKRKGLYGGPDAFRDHVE